MKRLITIIIVISSITTINAQITTRWFYNLGEEVVEPRQIGSSTLKFINEDEVKMNEFMLYHLLENALYQELQTFEDIEMTKPSKFPPSHYNVKLNFVDGAADTTICITDFRPNRTAVLDGRCGFLLHQTWNYDSLRHEITSTVDAISAVKIKDEDTTCFFTIPFQEIEVDVADRFDNSFKWAKQVVYNGNFKGQSLEKWVFDERHLTTHKIMNGGGRKIITKEKALSILEESTDTIITFDPSTFAPEMKIVTNPAFDIKDFEHYQITQVFYFDPSSMVFTSKIISVAPFGYGPIFIVAYDDDFYRKKEEKYQKKMKILKRILENNK